MLMANFQNFLNLTPIWLIGLLLFILMVAAAAGGLWFRRTRTRQGMSEGDKDEVGYVVSAVLGLLALLMGFTFSLAVDRFETRRGMVLEEANSIGTTYLRAQLLPEPHRTRSSDILVRYTENRVKLGRAASPDQIRPLLKINDDLTTDLWAATDAAFDSIKGLDFSSTYVDGVNQLIDLGTSRKAARMARVPAGVFAVELIYLIVTAAVLGYVLHGRSGQRTAIFLMALLTLALMLVIDIDRPVGGGIVESQMPMEWLLQSMKETPTTTYDRWREPPSAETVKPPNQSKGVP